MQAFVAALRRCHLGSDYAGTPCLMRGACMVTRHTDAGDVPGDDAGTKMQRHLLATSRTSCALWHFVLPVSKLEKE
jgi:hypothetical protein